MHLGHLIALAPVIIATSLSVNAKPIEAQPDEPPSTQQVEAPAPEPTPYDDSPRAQIERNKEFVRVFGEATFGSSEIPALMDLVQKESGFKNWAQNPTSTAYGLFQFLDSTWAGYRYTKTSDPIDQTQAGMNYIKQRYGSPSAALRFWKCQGLCKTKGGYVQKKGNWY